MYKNPSSESTRQELPNTALTHTALTHPTCFNLEGSDYFSDIFLLQPFASGKHGKEWKMR